MVKINEWRREGKEDGKRGRKIHKMGKNNSREKKA